MFIRYLKYLLLWCSLGLLIFPQVQTKYHLFAEKPLNGVYRHAIEPVNSWNSWIDGKYQDSLSKYLNENIGTHNTLVRINNQVNFSLFRFYNEKNFLVGEKNYLFEDYYINAYKGLDFIGYANMRKRVEGLQLLQERLKNLGITFIYVIEPSKVGIYPEYVPEYCHLVKPDTSNYIALSEILAEPRYKINYIDFYRYFKLIRDTVSYPLYPVAGVHWSTYSSQTMVTDSLLRFMEHASGRHLLPFRLSEVTWTKDLIPPDNELAETMNLLLPFPFEPMPYGKYTTGDTTGCFYPRVLTVADSYYWMIYSFEPLRKVFASHDYWYRFTAFYPDSKYDKITKDSVAFLREDLKKHDFIILMTTEINLSTLFGFVETANSFLNEEGTPLPSETREEMIIRCKSRIIQDKEWVELLKVHAKLRKVTLEQIIQTAAEYAVDQEINK